MNGSNEERKLEILGRAKRYEVTIGEIPMWHNSNGLSSRMPKKDVRFRSEEIINYTLLSTS